MPYSLLGAFVGLEILEEKWTLLTLFFHLQVKVLKKPRFDLGKLLEMHGESGKSTTATGEDVGAKVDRPDNYEPPVQSKV